jgi:hypothetical protein
MAIVVRDSLMELGTWSKESGCLASKLSSAARCVSLENLTAGCLSFLVYTTRTKRDINT